MMPPLVYYRVMSQVTVIFWRVLNVRLGGLGRVCRENRAMGREMAGLCPSPIQTNPAQRLFCLLLEKQTVGR